MTNREQEKVDRGENHRKGASDIFLECEKLNKTTWKYKLIGGNHMYS